MRKVTKVVFLCLTLLIPVLIYLFLQGFGENKFVIPVYYESGVESSFEGCNFETGRQHFIPNFSFEDQNGKKVDQSSLEDYITVVDFFFTACPDICPIMSNQMSRVQNTFSDNQNIQLLSLTVDPEHDTQEVLKTYAEQFYANPGQWHFLTGAKKDIYQLARCGFVLPVVDGDGGDGDFIHSNKLVLVDKERRIRGYYDGTDQKDVDRLVVEINILLKEYGL
ncbi:SCO family protein [Xanthovirga aplysinae]|uniref:SCO family protein n=1 Tax=Xanthovirga aplysinae TaxID=2529853 RepID=UPI0012BBEBEC|nr:SCO family protein [Xanthovirga aplysinae]MTI30544.1 SCO family protein [Xanthovirga aplysinae]